MVPFGHAHCPHRAALQRPTCSGNLGNATCRRLFSTRASNNKREFCQMCNYVGCTSVLTQPGRSRSSCAGHSSGKETAQHSTTSNAADTAITSSDNNRFNLKSTSSRSSRVPLPADVVPEAVAPLYLAGTDDQASSSGRGQRVVPKTRNIIGTDFGRPGYFKSPPRAEPEPGPAEIEHGGSDCAASEPADALPVVRPACYADEWILLSPTNKLMDFLIMQLEHTTAAEIMQLTCRPTTPNTYVRYRKSAAFMYGYQTIYAASLFSRYLDLRVLLRPPCPPNSWPTGSTNS